MSNISMIRLSALVLCIVGLEGSANAESVPSAARGKQTYMRVGCYGCHGTQGQGSGSGTKLAPDPLPAEAIAQFIRAQQVFMPSYSEKILSDAEVADIAAYLRSIKPSPTPDSISILKALKRSP